MIAVAEDIHRRGLRLADAPEEAPKAVIARIGGGTRLYETAGSMQDKKRIFITGGASGLGLAIAQRYASEGWKICIADINDERGEQARRNLARTSPDAVYLHCDVRHDEDLSRCADEMTKRWGGIDVVVNNAGVAGGGAIDDVSLENWRWIIDINLLGVVRGCRVFAPLFKRQRHGHFVNVASMAGLLDVPYMSSYNASKAAVISLSETLQNELADDGIGVTVVCPSFFRTNLGESMRARPELRDALDRLMSKSSVTAEQIADQTFVAVRDKRFYVLPHALGRRVWLLKRFLPRALYAKVMQRHTRRLRAATTQRGARSAVQNDGAARPGEE